ncbi:hypothetical protein Tco_0444239, partial [Tanacetum coccineum]
MTAVNGGQRRWTMVAAMVNGGGQRQSTVAVIAGPPLDHRPTTSQPLVNG